MAVSGSLGQGANGEEAVLMSYHNGSSSVRNRWVRTRSGWLAVSGVDTRHQGLTGQADFVV